MNKRDQILAKLAIGLGLVDDAGYKRAAQLMPHFPGRAFDRILLDTGLLDAAGHRRLVAAFNQRVAQARGSKRPSRRSLVERGLTDSDALLHDDAADGEWSRKTPKQPASDDAIYAEPTMVLADDDGPLVLKAGDSDEDGIFAEPTMVLRDDDPSDMGPDVFANPTQILDEGGQGVFSSPTQILDEDIHVPPTIVLKDDDEGIYAQPTLVIDEANDSEPLRLVDDSSDLLPALPVGDPSDFGDADMRLQRDVNRESARHHSVDDSDECGLTLNSVEFQRRLKSRENFVGFKIGDYRILGEIARGAFGVVLEAEPGGVTKSLAKDRGYEGTLALKVALENKSDPRAAERFVDETRVQIGFDHPHIVRIFDCGVEAGLTFYSMENIDGIEVRSFVQQNGPMPALLAVRVVKEIAEALAYVHQKRIYHRDLKPQNVMLDRAAKPFRGVLIDFGLVTEHLSNQDKGLILGTPSYMPPEQAQPRGGHGTINATSDVYSLGATFFYMLTGQPPFQDKKRDPRKIIKMVLNDDPPDPFDLNPNIPKRVADACLKCLEKRQRDRFHSAKQLAAELDKELRSGQRKLKAKSFFGRFLGKKP